MEGRQMVMMFAPEKEVTRKPFNKTVCGFARSGSARESARAL